MIEYRDLEDGFNEQFNSIQQYAFNFLNTSRKYNEKLSNEIWRGLIESGELLACLKIFDLQFINKGQKNKLGGIGGVAIPPEQRSKGFFRKLIKDTLYELNEKGYAFSALWPFSYSFYERFGWSQVSNHEYFELDLTTEKFIKDKYKVDLSNIRLFDGNYSLLNEIQAEYYKSNANFKVMRENDWWEYRIIKSKEENTFCYIYDDNNGSQGYIIYSSKDTENNKHYYDKKMKIKEILYTDIKAFIHLINFIFKHKSQIQKIEINLNDGDILSSVLKYNNSFHRKIMNGIMIRIINLDKLKLKMNHSINKSFKYKVHVKDDLLPWNNSYFILQVDNHRISFSKINSVKNSADFSLDINNLNKLLTGYFSLRQMLDYNLINISNDISKNEINMLERIFTKSNNYFPDHF